MTAEQTNKPGRPETDATQAVLVCLADVLEADLQALDPDTALAVLGLESVAAVRLRRLLRDELGALLPLSEFLGDATARTVALRAVQGAADSLEDGESQEAVHAPEVAVADLDAGEPFALTPIQAAYLVGRDPAFPLGGVATFYYHEFDRRPEDDPLADLERLEVAWSSLVRRHPMLRVVVGADARQRVLPEPPEYRIGVTDLRRHDPDGVKAALAELRDQHSHRVLPTDRWPLFELHAALLPDGRTRLLAGFDVLALDLASWMLIMREWGLRVADPACALPAIPTTFAALLRARASDPAERRRYADDRDYWSARGPQLPGGPALPWTAPIAQLGVPRVTRVHGHLDNGQWTRLRAAAATRGLSPTGLLLAAFALVLRRWGAADAFCLNTTLFDRADVAQGDRTEGLNSVVGDFTSTILVEIAANAPVGQSFEDFAAAVNRRFWTDMEHRSLAGVETLPRETDLETGLPVPRHPVVFTSGLGLAGAGGSPTSWLGETVFGVSQTPQVLLDHIVTDADGTLSIYWDVCQAALPAGLVDQMCAAHERLLTRLADDEGAWSDPGMGADPTFRAAEPVPPGAFAGAGPRLDDALRDVAKRTPDAPALLDAHGYVSHAALQQRAERTGAALAGLGLGPGDLVAVCADKGIGQVVAMAGVLASGAGYVPVEPSWPAERIASLVEQASVRHVLLGTGADLSVWPEGVAAHPLDADGVFDGPAGDPRRPDGDVLAYAIFTSGSTGKPKGVAVEHAAVRTTLDDLALRFPTGPEDRVLALSAFSFDLSVWDVFAVAGSGGAVVLPDPERQRDPGHWLELMAQHRVTVWNTAPALLEMLVEYAELEPEAVQVALAPLRLVFLSADWIPVTLPDRLRALAPDAEVVSLGGATEASIWSICYPIGTVDPDWASIPYGRALRGQSFDVLDADGRPCPVGEVGELYIGGEGLARGYVGDPVQTAERFAVHPVLGRRLYRTGDLGRWRTDGTIEFLGRVDRQVKIRGHRIELGEIEATLNRLPAVRQAVARAVPGPDDRPRLVGHIVPADPAEPPTDDELRTALLAALPSYMVPNRFLQEESLPISANGKIDYKALRNPYRRDAVPQDAPMAPAEAPRPAPTPEPDQVSAPAPVPAPLPIASASSSDVLAVAAKAGLQVRMVIAAGELAPVAALAAAARWAEHAIRGLDAAGFTIEQRLPADGLVELVLTTAASAPAASAPQPAVPAMQPASAPATQPAPAPVSDLSGTIEADPQVERTVARVLSELLGDLPVDVTTPFFQLGASSLTLVLAHRRLHAELDPGLLVVDLFAHPTVRDLARFLTARRSPATTVPAPAAPTAPTPNTLVTASELPGTGPGSRRAAARARALQVAR